MPTTPGRHFPTTALIAAAAAVLAACAGLPAAQMALPAPLHAVEPVTVAGLGAGRSGAFTLADAGGTFQRGRDRLALFDVLTFDRATTRYELQGPDGRRLKAACLGRQTDVTVGIVNAAARPYTLSCEWSGARDARMTLAAPASTAATRARRQGRFSSGDVTLELQSVHEVQGSPLPLEAPIGYLITHAGQPVGAVEINGMRPRLWRPAEGSPLREPVTMAALAVALLWDPAADLP